MGTKGTWKRDAQISPEQEERQWAAWFPCTKASDLGIYPAEAGHCTRRLGHLGPCAYVFAGVDTGAHPDAS